MTPGKLYKVRVALDAKGVKSAVVEASEKGLMMAGALVEREAKLSMRQGGKQKGKGPLGGKLRGIPSEPGTPPHVQTGNLRASITHALASAGIVIAGTTPAAWYGKIHEHGGRNHPRRPFMRPALIAASPKFAALFKSMNLAATKAGRQLNQKRGTRP